MPWRQATQDPDLKTQLAHLLWWLLLGIGERQDFTPSHEALVLPKIVALRNKPLATVFFDAGSTVHSAAKSLLESRNHPLRVPTKSVTWAKPKAPDGPDLGSLLSVRLATHSLPVMALFSKHNKKERLPEPVFVGGQYRHWSESMGGLLAETCLREWGLRFDVAIIGTAGYLSGPDGGFGSGIVDEAQTKLLFLSRAALRVIVCHSEKLRRSSNPAAIFAPLNPANIDLVIRDDGVESGCAEDVAAFQEEAHQSDLPTVLLKTSAG